LEITRPNQVWSADITYIRLSKGYLYAVAIVDNYSRKVLSLKLSNTLDAYFCIEAAREAVGKYGYPEMVHTDRGSQFVSEGFRRVFVRQDGTSSRFSLAGRAQENPYVERFFRSYKYECLMLYELKTPQEVKEVSQKWVRYYNKERPHQALGYKTPDRVYQTGVGGGALIVDKFANADESSTSCSQREIVTTTTESRLKSGQRRPAAIEVECTT